MWFPDPGCAHFIRYLGVHVIFCHLDHSDHLLHPSHGARVEDGDWSKVGVPGPVVHILLQISDWLPSSLPEVAVPVLRQGVGPQHQLDDPLHHQSRVNMFTQPLSKVEISQQSRSQAHQHTNKNKHPAEFHQDLRHYCEIYPLFPTKVRTSISRKRFVLI